MSHLLRVLTDPDGPVVWYLGITLICTGAFAWLAHNAQPLEEQPPAPIYPLDLYRQRRLHASPGVKPRPRGGRRSEPLPQKGRPAGSGRTTGRPEGTAA